MLKRRTYDEAKLKLSIMSWVAGNHAALVNYLKARDGGCGRDDSYDSKLN